jgi:hypothetical protein
LVVDAGKNEHERKRKRKTLLSEKKEVRSKKSLTESALLEMSGYATTHPNGDSSPPRNLSERDLVD